MEWLKDNAAWIVIAAVILLAPVFLYAALVGGYR